MIVIIAVHGSDQAKYQHVIDDMFKTRKAVFADALGWEISTDGEFERDQYDQLNPIYLIWCDRECCRHYGSIRLMPTTGPTLLHDVFYSSFPDPTEVRGNGIWEGTRMCLNDHALSRDFPGLSPGKGFSLLLLGLCEFGLEIGIHTLVSNYAPHFKRIYSRAGAQVREVGRSHDFGSVPVCCGIFEVSPTVLEIMRRKVGRSEPVLRARMGLPLHKNISSCTTSMADTDQNRTAW